MKPLDRFRRTATRDEAVQLAARTPAWASTSAAALREVSLLTRVAGADALPMLVTRTVRTTPLAGKLTVMTARLIPVASPAKLLCSTRFDCPGPVAGVAAGIVPVAGEALSQLPPPRIPVS